MAKRAKLRVIAKLEQCEMIPNCIRFKYELTSSKEVTGNSNFFNLISASSMAILNCQEELKTYMVHAAEMEIAIINKKYQAVFHQALKGFTQLLLINKGARPQEPLKARIRELALSALEWHTEYFTTGNRFHLTDDSLFLDYKQATKDSQPTWTNGRARPTFLLVEHTIEIDIIAGLLYGFITQCWLKTIQEMQEKEKAALLQTTQQAFFNIAATKDTAKSFAKEKSMDQKQMDKVITDKIASEAKYFQASLS
jgi:hypothetical protein